MFRISSMVFAVAMVLAGTALADPIEGNWKTQSGETAAIGGCGDAFCITLKTGKHAGKQIGKMTAGGEGNYAGSITDPAEDKTYKGKAKLSGSALKMSGCVFGGLICKSQNWSKL
jgi:uncharacterized protein (DUF2147 family)